MANTKLLKVQCGVLRSLLAQVCDCHMSTAHCTPAFLQVEVLRGGSFKQMPSQTLVPGDIIAVVPGVLPADCVLLTGECIVDENMLTGDSAEEPMD